MQINTSNTKLTPSSVSMRDIRIIRGGMGMDSSSSLSLASYSVDCVISTLPTKIKPKAMMPTSAK